MARQVLGWVWLTLLMTYHVRGEDKRAHITRHVTGTDAGASNTDELIRALKELQSKKAERLEVKDTREDERANLRDILREVIDSEGSIQTRENEDEKRCSNDPADIVFVLDESGSIWGPDFKRQIEFVKDVVRDFDVSQGMTHIGWMTFGTDPLIYYHLDEKHGESEILGALNEVSQRRGGTRTFDAIKEMRTMFLATHARPGVPHIAILITDGESENMERTKQEAAIAHQDITMFAIGIGRKINEQELHNIASSPDYIFTADNYRVLEKIREELSWTACQVTTMRPTQPPTTTPPTTTPTTPSTTTMPQSIEECDAHYPADIHFAMSDQAGVEGTDYSLRYINSIAERVSLGVDKTLVGVTPRACDSTAPAIRLRDQDNPATFSRHLSQRNLTGADTAEHLRYMHNEGILPSNGARPLEETARFGILIIDNKAADREETIKQAKKVKRDGIHLIVLGVGPYVDETELDAIATTNDDWFHIGSYSDLQTLADPVMDRICELVLSRASAGEREARIYE